MSVFAHPDSLFLVGTNNQLACFAQSEPSQMISRERTAASGYQLPRFCDGTIESVVRFSHFTVLLTSNREVYLYDLGELAAHALEGKNFTAISASKNRLLAFRGLEATILLLTAPLYGKSAFSSLEKKTFSAATFSPPLLVHQVRAASSLLVLESCSDILPAKADSIVEICPQPHSHQSKPKALAFEKSYVRMKYKEIKSRGRQGSDLSPSLTLNTELAQLAKLQSETSSDAENLKIDQEVNCSIKSDDRPIDQGLKSLHAKLFSKRVDSVNLSAKPFIVDGFKVKGITNNKQSIRRIDFERQEPQASNIDDSTVVLVRDPLSLAIAVKNIPSLQLSNLHFNSTTIKKSKVHSSVSLTCLDNPSDVLPAIPLLRSSKLSEDTFFVSASSIAHIKSISARLNEAGSPLQKNLSSKKQKDQPSPPQLLESSPKDFTKSGQKSKESLVIRSLANSGGKSPENPSKSNIFTDFGLHQSIENQERKSLQKLVKPAFPEAEGMLSPKSTIRETVAEDFVDDDKSRFSSIKPTSENADMKESKRTAFEQSKGYEIGLAGPFDFKKSSLDSTHQLSFNPLKPLLTTSQDIGVPVRLIDFHRSSLAQIGDEVNVNVSQGSENNDLGRKSNDSGQKVVRSSRHNSRDLLEPVDRLVPKRCDVTLMTPLDKLRKLCNTDRRKSRPTDRSQDFSRGRDSSTRRPISGLGDSLAGSHHEGTQNNSALFRVVKKVESSRPSLKRMAERSLKRTRQNSSNMNRSSSRLGIHSAGLSELRQIFKKRMSKYCAHFMTHLLLFVEAKKKRMERNVSFSRQFSMIVNKLVRDRQRTFFSNIHAAFSGVKNFKAVVGLKSDIMKLKQQIVEGVQKKEKPAEQPKLKEQKSDKRIANKKPPKPESPGNDSSSRSRPSSSSRHQTESVKTLKFFRWRDLGPADKYERGAFKIRIASN